MLFYTYDPQLVVSRHGNPFRDDSEAPEERTTPSTTHCRFRVHCETHDECEVDGRATTGGHDPVLALKSDR